MITKKASSILLTDAMIENYYTGTKKHLGDVFKFIDRIIKTDPDKYKDLKMRKLLYDLSKNSEPEFTPYVLQMWKDKHPEFELSDAANIAIRRAVMHHWKNNRHHPEFHDGSFKLKNVVEGDDDIPPNKLVDATGMQPLDLAEMVADWCALAGDNGKTPEQWAKEHISVHYKFSPEQVKTIYELIKAIK